VRIRKKKKQKRERERERKHTISGKGHVHRGKVINLGGNINDGVCGEDQRPDVC